METVKIRCKDLVVGDWVANRNGSPMQIVAVDEDNAYACEGNEAYACEGNEERPWIFGDDEGYDPQPIELTPEILENNGFIKVNSQRYDYGYPDTDCYVKVNPKKNMIHVNGRNANSNLYSHSFVHELQRALRLCGFDELAENFKV